VVDQRLFREAMSRPTIARELFLPVDRAWWDGDRFTLGRWSVSTPRPIHRGVRFQEPRPATLGPPPERDTQCDLLALIGSVAELRTIPEFSSLVLSDETLIGKQQGTVPGKRIVFGLRCPANGQCKAEGAAAAECQRVLNRAIRKAGFAVEHPNESFDSNAGFAGLRDWVGSIRLRRAVRRRAWLALVLLLPLLLFFVPIPGTASVPPGSPTAGPAGANPASPAAPSTDPAALLKQITNGSDPNQILKDLAGSSSGLPPSLGGTGPPDTMSKYGVLMVEVGTVLYFLSGAWLIWVAPGAGIGAVIGLLVVPGYALLVAKSDWSKTWMPLAVHALSIVMMIAGIYYMVAPYYRMLQGALG
jgi:hypothetical protein